MKKSVIKLVFKDVMEKITFIQDMEKTGLWLGVTKDDELCVTFPDLMFEIPETILPKVVTKIEYLLENGPWLCTLENDWHKNRTSQLVNKSLMTRGKIQFNWETGEIIKTVGGTVMIPENVVTLYGKLQRWGMNLPDPDMHIFIEVMHRRDLLKRVDEIFGTGINDFWTLKSL